MNRKIIALALCLSISGPMLGGCSFLGKVVTASTGTVSDVAPDTMLAAKKGLIAAHDTHEAAALALTLAANSGVVHGANAVTAKKWLDDSEAYLSAADDLVALGDAPGIEAKISAANTLSAKVQGLIGTK